MKKNKVLQAESEQHEKTNDAEVEGEDAAMEGEDATVKPIQPEQPSESRVAELEVPPPIVDNVVHEKIQPEPLVVIIPVQPELNLRPWLQPEAETSVAKVPLEATDEIITHVLLSMNQEGPSTQDGNQIQQTTDEDQCKTPETALVTLKERCFIWAIMENDNKYETIFQLRGQIR
ncbi:hypothetical protein PIB30_080150 [Stylosanthes scabra]|uniref:Uncharacterized protein n=1 Tax=Stylosanthes scabra TaxID=79078 RepID=A0ABU6XT48_9FABA|nr:hypothetical protein [Stylosanthes scabra]